MGSKLRSDQIEFIEENITSCEKVGIIIRIPDFLYKYSPINPNFLDSVSQYYLWLSKPTEFNDFFDSRILLDTDSAVNDIDGHMNTVFKNFDFKQKAINMYTKIREYDPALFHDLVNIPYLNVVGNFGICCFSTKCDNLLMWSHYANRHKGVCVKYNFENEKYISSILHPVTYSKEYPKVKYVDSYNYGVFEKLFLTKSIDWKNEDEWRLVQTKYATNLKYEDGGPKNYGRLDVNKSSIVEVVFGCNAVEADIEYVKHAFIDAGYSSVVFKQASEVNFRYQLKFTEIGRI